jgi:hypothetical protein
MSHPYFDKTVALDDPLTHRKAGEALITDVPPGEYDVEMWHEGVFEKVNSISGVPNSVAYSSPFTETTHVTVAAGAEAVAEIVFTPK